MAYKQASGYRGLTLHKGLKLSRSIGDRKVMPCRCQLAQRDIYYFRTGPKLEVGLPSQREALFENGERTATFGAQDR